MNFIISDDDGLQYSKISGDNNKIHIDELTGYNSIFGEKICSKYNVPYKIFRFPAINSRQSISLLNNNLPNLVEHINANKSLISKIFFIKS